MMSEISRLRVGSGFDVHAFVEGRPLILGGVEIPHTHGLDGHSDADALIHAVVDAILGALALGDIGHHFPPSDSKWKNAPSTVFLEHAQDLVRKEGGEILSVDATLLLERPKIKDYVPRIRARLSELMQIGLDRVSVKATTTETLGFVGRSEGIAAQAVCLVLRGATVQNRV